MKKGLPRDAQHQEGHPRAGLGPSDAPSCLIGSFRVDLRIVFSGSKAKTRQPSRLFSPPMAQCCRAEIRLFSSLLFEFTATRFDKILPIKSRSLSPGALVLFGLLSPPPNRSQDGV